LSIGVPVGRLKVIGFSKTVKYRFEYKYKHRTLKGDIVVKDVELDVEFDDWCQKLLDDENTYRPIVNDVISEFQEKALFIRTTSN
jgi:hypothetical protein